MTDGLLVIAVILDSRELQSWVYSSLEKAKSIGSVEFVFVERPDKVRKNRLPVELFYRLDNKFRGKERKPDAFAMRNGETLFARAVRWDQLREIHPDIIVSYSAQDLPDRVAEWSRLGLWQHRLTSSSGSSGSIAGYLEFVERRPVSESRLESIASGERPVTLARSWSTTDPFSPLVNLNYVAWSAAQLLERQIRRVFSLGVDAFLASYADMETNSLEVSPDPGWCRVSLLTLRYLVRAVSEFVYEKLYWDRWEMAYQLGDGHWQDFSKYTRITPPNEEFWADPHLIRRGDDYFIFFEIYKASRNLGHLAVMKIDSSGACSQPKDILVKDYHLSYPHLIEDQGRLYMVPETKGNKTIEIYECVGFPDRGNSE